MTNFEPSFEPHVAAPEGSPVYNVDEISEGMRQRARRFGAMHHIDPNLVSTLMDELKERGLTMNDLSMQDLYELTEVEGNLEQEYLRANDKLEDEE